ncbi:Short chain dehydrogenase [Geitlerinema sp. FC II]|uniref:SDR family oxidoreductase n=1 Tax=Baaleninema simplex TaxID=2862350 RepID=UPI00034B6F61|nr:SDR family oxidoreductase [Baaleninema simplex]MDC0836001.1 SDR family oxidoreductase [Geitlerinema sp. CS-897]PPT06681.1 Short chain dehydrogenase [Geitlerinema sp. FC II]
MGSVKDRIVFVTGASSGIGASCAKFFAEAGAKLILAARRSDRLETLAAELHRHHGTDVRILKLDVRDRQQVAETLATLPQNWQEIDILINNAGLSRGLDKLHEGNIDDWEEMIDANVKGLLYVTRAVVPGMVERDRGHIINIGSIAGRHAYPNGNVYCASKAAVRAITQGLKQDLLGTSVRVSEVDPGLVETEFSDVRFHGDTERAKKVYENLTPLTPDDIADIVLFCASRPLHVNISEVLVVPTEQATATQVVRRG